MAKSQRRANRRDWDDEEFQPSKKDRQRDQQRRKDRRLRNAIRSNDIDSLLDQDDY